MTLFLVVTLCSSITSGHPGCLEDRYPLTRDTTPMACFTKAQELMAKKPYGEDWKPYRYGCVRG